MDPSAIGALVAELLLAVHLLTGYALPEGPPEVVFVPHETLERQACNGPCRVYGWFPPGDTIYLAEDLDPVGDVGARGVLVHELVHFLQQESGAFAGLNDCQSWTSREREAFDVQIRWLTEQRAPLSALSRYGLVPLRGACHD